jgi:exonuclease SbcC
MQIETVELKNIGPHRELTAELSSGIVGIVGANGAGKSSFVNAIYAAFTGDFTRFNVATKAEAINNQAAKHEKSWIKIVGNHGCKPFELVRSLRPNEVTFTYGDSEIETASQVNGAVFKLLGLTPSVFDRYVFVEQWEMFSFLDDTESVRAKAFQHLCGVESATSLHKACVQFRDRLTAKQSIDNSLDLESNIDQIQREMLRLKRTKFEGLLPDDEAAELRQKRDLYLKVSQLESLKSQGLIDLEALKNVLGDKEKVFQDVETKFNRAADWLKKHKTLLEAAVGTLRDWQAQSSLQSKQVRCRSLIRDWEAKVEATDAEIALHAAKSPSFSKEELAGLKAELQSLRTKAKELKTAVSNLEQGSRAVCSSCMQNIPASHSVKLKAEADAVERLAVEKARQVMASQNYCDRSEYLLELRREQQGLLVKYQSELQGLSQASQSIVTQDAADRATAALEQRKKAEASFAESKPKRDRLKAELDVLRGRISNAESQLQEYEAQLATLTTDLGSADASIQEKLERHDEALRQKAAVSAEYKTNATQLSTLQATLNKLKTSLAREAKTRSLAEVVDRVANAFHWSGLPKRVAQNNLMQLEADINTQLELFSSPFLVETTDDLSFKATFPGKPSVSARQLSGGQKVILAIAFRAALDRLFGHNIGMLFLDEPTAGLDADNVAYFHDAMQSWSANVGAQKQIIVITHVQDMTSAFDQIVTIDK